MEKDNYNEGYWFDTRVDKGGETAMNFLRARFPYRDWEERFASKKVLRNGVVLTGEEVLAKEDQLRSFREPWIEPPVDDTLEIVAESKHLVIVNKRKEYPVVPHGDFLQNSLLNIVRRKFPEAAPLHRLGRGTTGAIVFAKTSEGAKQNCRLFESRQVKKVYRCVVSGVPPWDVLEAECFIGPVPWPGTNGGVFAAVPNEEAHKNKQNKRSLTTFTVVKRGDGWAVLDANIFTGRPHQIRIMTGYVGFPLLGDPLYGVGGVPKVDGLVFDESGHDRPACPGDTGYLLHSMTLEISELKCTMVAPPNKDEWEKYLVFW